MSTLVWISGASAGIGAALAAAVPYPDARVIDISRSGGTTPLPGSASVPGGTAEQLSQPASVPGGTAEHLSRPPSVPGGTAEQLSQPASVPGGTAEHLGRPASFAGGTAEHFRADLADPGDWSRLAAHFADELSTYDGERVVFIHNAGTITPIGPAAGADPDAYRHAVLLNSAAPQVLGAAFLRATAQLTCERHLIMLSSGAAKTAYAGWSSYNAGKAAVEHWVRTVGQEQPADGCRVIAVAPGVVDTAMQSEIRATDETDFPSVGRFHELERTGALSTPEAAATGIWSLLTRDLPNGSCVDLRNL